MKKRHAAALLATVAAALAYRPTRQWVGDAMIDAGIRLAYDPPPPRSPAAMARSERRIMAAIEADARDSAGRNGKSPWPV